MTTEPHAPPAAATTTDRRAIWLNIGLGLVLVAAVLIAGTPSLDAPWLQGDEHIFIVNNPDVTGAGLADPSPGPRLKRIFRFPPIEDLYQPLPILTYALQWSSDPGAAETLRRTDVFLHALNALLFWWLAAALLARLHPQAHARLVLVLTWALALVWAVHPVLVSAWAADMGRTHLLSATFALLALRLHLHSLQPGRGYWFVGAMVALVAAMLSKPVVGWILLVLMLEATLVGWRNMLRSARIYVVGVICVGFAILTYWTSQRSGMVEDAAAGLFGDPIARSALAVWLYVRNTLAPLWLSPWYLPDPRTGWAYPLVWLGLLLALASVIHAAWAYRRPAHRGVSFGWVWCWALLLPVIGLVGAREAAAADRYLYQPLMGAFIVLGSLILRWSASRGTGQPRRAIRPIAITAAILAALLLLWSLPHVKMYRSTLQRRQRLVAQNPGDPRALEALASACDFASNHAITADDFAQVPRESDQYVYFLTRFAQTLRQAAATPNLETYFPGPEDRAPFHRRLSNMFKMLRQYPDSLTQAEIARNLQPDTYFTWVRLAHAYQGLRRWDDAVQAYERCEALLPDDPGTRATHFTDFGYLLLFDLERPELAYPKFRAAIATGAARSFAEVGLARCEIRVGEGARGYEMVMRVLDRNPQNALAGLVLAEYHLRSHHWTEAANVYAALLAAYPTVYPQIEWYYEALRGYQSVCAQTGQFRDAALAWDQAVARHPERPEFRAFRVWALACEGSAEAHTWTDQLLADDPNNPFGCLAKSLTAARQSELEEAVEWIRRATRGEPIPKSRAIERAAAIFSILAANDRLPPEAAIVEAAAHLYGGQPHRAGQNLTAYLEGHPDSPWQQLAAQLLEETKLPTTSQGAPDGSG